MQLHIHSSSPVEWKAEKSLPLQNVAELRLSWHPHQTHQSTEGHRYNQHKTGERTAYHLNIVAQSETRRLNLYNGKAIQRHHSPLRPNMVHVKNPAPTLKRRKVGVVIDHTQDSRSPSRNKAQGTPELSQSI